MSLVRPQEHCLAFLALGEPQWGHPPVPMAQELHFRMSLCLCFLPGLCCRSACLVLPLHGPCTYCKQLLPCPWVQPGSGSYPGCAWDCCEMVLGAPLCLGVRRLLLSFPCHEQ